MKTKQRLLKVLNLFTLVSMLLFALQVQVTPASAAGGSYTISWSAADPANYAHKFPSQLLCPAPSGSTGRAANPLVDAAYGSPKVSVQSLEPKNIALGQIVAFEAEIVVKGSTSPENGVITFTPEFLAKTTSGGDYGFDPNYGIYCAFVDTADSVTVHGGTAKVSTYTDTIVNSGTSNEAIQGDITVSGLTDGDTVVVEIWVVLKGTVPAGASGNVQTSLVSAKTATGDAISTGNQTVPLSRVASFFSVDADLSVTKSDSPDPVVLGNLLTYTITAANHSTDTVSNDVVVTDTLDPNTTFVSGTWSGGSCSAASGVVTCNLGALPPGTSVTITLVVSVKLTAPTAGTVQTGACTVGATGVDLCNTVAIAALTNDPTPANNSDSEPTNVTGTSALSLSKSASPATYSAVGQTISYSYVLTNSGDVPLSSPFAVTDDKATVTCPATSSLAAGATLTCTASYTIKQSDLDAGSVTNNATATATFNGNTVTSNQATATVTATQTKTLSLTKSASPSTYDTVGQTISYSYVIKNTGNVTLSGPFSVADDKATVTCTQPADSALSPDETMSCSASYPITQADLDASEVTNRATATNGAVTSNEATATVNAVAKPNLSLVKSATPATYSKVGDVISYSYVVENIGNVALSGPFAVADDKATDESCPQTPDPLPVGSSITCTASYAITQADLDAGSVTNHATATAMFGGNTVTSNQAQATVNAVKKPALALDKTAQETTYAKAGDVIHYSYKVTNSGNVTLHDAITVSDNKTTAACPALPAGGLAPGEFITCTASYAVTQADLDAGSVTNVASATSGTTTSNTDTVTVTATQSPALALDKSASPATYTSAGQTISYSYELKNTGNVTLSGPFAVADDKATVACPAVASLAVGDTLTCSASHTVTQAEVDAGSITNRATATATFGGKPVTSNEATATVIGLGDPGLSLVKSAKPTTYETVGKIIDYSYVLTNTGSLTLSGPFSVSDDKLSVSCPAIPVSLAPGASITCTASHTITQADIDAGSITNHATAHAFVPSGQSFASNEASATVNALQQGGISLTKSATPATYSKVGDVVSYSYVVENTGNITLAGPFTVNDDIVGAVSCPLGSLAPNATVTCTASYSITQADLDSGSVTNHATATDGKLTSNQAEATVTADQKPALAIDKTAQETTYAKASDVIHYSYKVTNSGNVTLHDAIVVSDDKATDESCPALPVGGLAPGASITCTASYAVTQADLDAGSVTNVASAASGTTVSPTDTVTVTANQSPALTLKKSAKPITYTTLDQEITYDYLLTNSGNVTLSGPFAVTDDKATVACPPAVTSLAPGEMLNCTATYTISQADLDGGNVTNVATATATFDSDTVTSNPDTATITAIQDPDLTLVKTATPSTYDEVGDTISYSYKLTNSGNVTLAGPFTVSDNKAVVTCPATASLAPAAFITCTASYAVKQADLDGGWVTNTATGHAAFGGKPVDSNQDSQTVYAVQSADLSLVKTASPLIYDTVGQPISYSYVLKNIGNVTLAGPFTVSDNKAAVTCPANATLAVNATLTCSATYAITQADLDAGAVTNTATGHGKTLGGTPVNSNNANATVTADQKPALAIDKTAQESTYAKAGDVIHYSYKVTNSGNVTLHDAITVSDNKTTATCPALPAGGLAPGEFITCSATYTITQADLDAGSLTNVAYALSGATKSPTDTVTLNATKNPHLTLTKTATPHFSNPVQVGDAISYELVATNDGNITLNNVSISDVKLGALSCTPAQPAMLAPTEKLTCAGSYSLTQADINAGHVANTAYATSKLPGGGTGPSGQDSEDVTVPQNPHLTLIKSGLLDITVVAPIDRADPGDKISYTLTATNDGNVTLTHVTITDAKLGTLSCAPAQPATLAPGEALACTGSYTLKLADINAGKVDNTGIAKSDQTPDAEAPNEVTVPQAPSLILTKSGLLNMAVVAPSNRADAGDKITYTLTATNTGNVTLTGVTISDPLLPLQICSASQPATLAPGASLTCKGVYTLTQADINAGKVNNTAIADSDQTPPTETPNEVPIPQVPALLLDKTASPMTYSKVGDIIAYSYKVTNSGNLTLTQAITVTDDKETVSCPALPAGGLAPAAFITCTASRTITQADLDAGKITNVAFAESDTVKSNNDTVTVNADQSIKISLTKVAGETVYDAVGNVLHYTLVATNSGNVTLSNVTISDPLLGALTCTPDQPATLVPAATISCTGSYTITQDDLDAGKVMNTATAKGYLGDKEASDTASATVNAAQQPGIDIQKTPDLQKIAIGDPANFTITVTNTGNVTLHGVAVADTYATLCAKSIGILDPGESVTYPCMKSGVTKDFTNVAIVTGWSPIDTKVTDQDTAEVDVLPAIHVTKTPSPTRVLFTGGNVKFTFKVTNLSYEPVTITALVDDVFGDLASACGLPRTLAAKTGTTVSSFTCSITKPLIGDPGTYHTNTVTATGKDNEENIATDSATAKVYFYWRGRTPGYWKNHTGSYWPYIPGTTTRYKTGDLVTKYFAVPPALLTNGILDLNKNGSPDTLLNALNYQGGSGLAGAAQILMRAAVAGLLNEATFGATYPPYNSVAELVAAVNAALATENRGAMLQLAGTLDYWNNGVH